MNITLVGRSELGNQRKDIRCAEEQFFKQLIQFSKSVLDIKTGACGNRCQIRILHQILCQNTNL